MTPYRTLQVVLRQKAPRASVWSLVVWWATRGARRLRAARMRRAGARPSRAVAVMTGHFGMARLLIEMIKAYPGIYERHEAWMSLARKLSAPKPKCRSAR